MSLYNFDNKSWQEGLLIKIGLLMISVILLVVFFPRGEHLKLQFELGKPWRYGAIITDFDFPILKTDKDIESERDSILRSFVPYYNRDNSIPKKQLELIRKQLSDSCQELSTYEIDIVLQQLSSIYVVGVIGAEEYNTLLNGSKRIRYIHNNTVIPLTIDKLYSTVMAYKKIMADNAVNRSILQSANLSDYIVPNLLYDSVKSDAGLNDLRSAVTIASGVILSGQKLIDRGDIITQDKYNILSSYEREWAKRHNSSLHNVEKIAGETLFIFLLLLSFTVYLVLFRNDYFDRMRNVLMIYALVIVFTIVCYVTISFDLFNIYILPFTMVPIFSRIFFDSRTAFFSHFIMILLCASVVQTPYEFIIVQMLAGVIAIDMLKELSSRSQLIKTVFVVTVGSAAVYFAMELIQYGDITKLDKTMYLHFCENGVLLLFAYPLMWAMEKAFGFTSEVTLIELSNTSNGLLRQLSEIAPGTFQHSIQVSNLAFEVANKIGAKAPLVRTGALYHDIGKMINPVFFIENQSSINPHDKISSIESAQIIISHISEGLKLAEKNALPKIISDFILTHHGQGKCKFFYMKYKEEHPDEEPIDTLAFVYPGVNPFTREQAILMMADSVEAASRSLIEYNDKTIGELVDRIVNSQLEDGFFVDCPITFRDIAKAKTILKEKLKTIYHTRVKYPEPVRK